MLRRLSLDVIGSVGESVRLQGWVHTRRDMGKISFIDLRDRSGILQVVCVPAELDEQSVRALKEIRPEFCVEIEGVVQRRNKKQQNSHLPTGSIELLAQRLVILNASKTPPFELDNTIGVNEEVRLKYRYLDLRSPRMHRNLVLRDRISVCLRDALHREDFLEVETPCLTKGTPEGAREFIVPSRLHPGEFYVLPQSPQQFKQLLMVGGVERYFQFARCFRDEDQRGDRQPEFTQLDVELSFIEREDILQIMEKMMIHLIKTVSPEKRIQTLPFPRLSYAEAMKRYGTDRPDLRDNKQDPSVLAFCWVLDFPFFERTEAPLGSDAEWTFTHNPFSAPVPEHLPWLMEKENIGDILTTQYDVVLNGYEIGGGSIRNHQPEALHRVFEVLGFSDEEIHNQFGHMLEAFAYGAPPHGGMAFGFDRLVMLLADEPNIREVIPIPKTGDARDVMMGAPSVIDAKRLREAHIRVEIKKSS